MDLWVRPAHAPDLKRLLPGAKPAMDIDICGEWDRGGGYEYSRLSIEVIP
jgi:hypothetical protein